MQAVTCQRDWDKSDRSLYEELAREAIDRGVMPDLDAREPWFLCYEHSDQDIDETLNVYAEIVRDRKAESSCGVAPAGSGAEPSAALTEVPCPKRT